MMSNKQPISNTWRESYNEALDLIREDAAAAHQIGASMVACAGDNEAQRLSGELVQIFSDFRSFGRTDTFDRLSKLLPKFEQCGDVFALVGCLYCMACVSSGQGMYQVAYEFGQKRLLPLLQELGTCQEVARVSLMLGVLAVEYNQPEEAMSHYFSALAMAQTLDLPKHHVAHIKANIGELLCNSGNSEEAETLLQQALDLIQGENRPWIQSYITTIFAMCQLALGKYDNAYEVLAPQVAHWETLLAEDPNANIAQGALCLSIAAYTLTEQGQILRAQKLFDYITAHLEQVTKIQHQSYIWWVCGHLHHRFERLDAARLALHCALDCIGLVDFDFVSLRAHEELTQIYAEQGQWQQAFAAHQRYHALFARTQGKTSRLHRHILHIQDRWREADTARRHADQVMAERQRLKESLKERDLILENSMVGISYLNPAGRLKWANRPLLHMFGMPEEEYPGTSLETFYCSRSEYLRVGTETVAAVAQGNSYTTEVQMKHADGSLFWVSLSGRAVNQRDLSEGTVWIMVNIDQRRRLEVALTKSEEHYREVVNNVTEGIMVTQDEKIVFANPRILQITGRTQEELFSIPILSDVHPDDAAHVHEQYLRRYRGESAEKYFTFRIIPRATNGEVRWIELSAVMIEWEGRPASLSFLNDITERKYLEDSLEQSHQEMVRLQALKFQSELTEAEIARRHAEETTKAKSMFLANMSHEIRTPMNAVIGMAHLALCSDLNPKQRDYVEKIHDAGILLLGIINDILDFSRIEAGKLTLESVDFSLDKVISNATTVTCERANAKDLQYTLRVAPGIPRQLTGDPLRLGQVLINLLNNGIKFTEKGSVFMQCVERERTSEKIKLEFSVQDTGIGMTEEQCGKLFQAFSQADGSTTRRYGGTGLGLSIAKAMVELMGGEIWLTSQIGVGTTFFFTVWFGIPDIKEQEALVIPKQLDGMRVLVVDDSPNARVNLADLLSTLPVEVDFAFGGNEALTAIRSCDGSWPYGIVFTDLDMPGLDGINLIWEVRRDNTLKAKPRMILLTEQGREDARLRAENAMLDGFLFKPVNTSLLIDLLIQIFAKDDLPAERPELVAPPSFSNLHILLVEDNEINQMIATELLHAVNVTVEIANNGKIAVDLLQGSPVNHFGMVLMDVQMPVMDGHESTKLIRQDPRFKNLPIVAMTAHAIFEERTRCMTSGMNDHLGKPIDPHEFYQMIARWCPEKVISPDVLPLDLMESELVSDDNTLVIPGFDVQDGLNRMLGDRELYLELLQRFRDGQTDIGGKIRCALMVGETKMAERLTHTLKGVAGMIGARYLQQLASKLELAIRNNEGEAEIERNNTQLELEMQTLFKALEKVLLPVTPDPADANAPGALPFNRNEIQLAISKFADFLRQYDSEALDALSEASPIFSIVLGEDTHRRIVRAIRIFDFDAALSVLEHSASQLGYSTTSGAK
jgi:two-component system, sensor histidine kinase and response regulator